MTAFKPVVAFKPAPAKIAGPTVVKSATQFRHGELDTVVVGRHINPELHRERLALAADRSQFRPR